MSEKKLPDGWKIVKLGEVCEVKGGKRIPKGYSLIKENNGYPYIRITDMDDDGNIKLDDLHYVPLNVVNIIKNYKISINDLFISVAGTIGVVGKIPQCLNNANLTENADKLTNINQNQDYLKYFLKSDNIKNQIKESVTNNAQPKLAIDKIKNFTLHLPPLHIQQRIAAILSKADEEVRLHKEITKKLEERNKGLSQKLLSGEIDLTNFNL